MEKLLKYSGGTVCGKPAGPEGMMPRVPRPVTKPRLERLAKLPSGLLVMVEVRKKLRWKSFTCVGPKVLMLFITISWAREGVMAGKPGTLAPELGRASLTVVSS